MLFFKTKNDVLFNSSSTSRCGKPNCMLQSKRHVFDVKNYGSNQRRLRKMVSI